MTMNPFEYGNALADSWMAAGKALLSAQGDVSRVFAESMKAAAAAFSGATLVPEPSGDMAEFTRANQALMALWSEAASLSAVLSSKLPVAAAGEASPAVDVTFSKILDPGLWLAGGGEIDEALNRITGAWLMCGTWSGATRACSGPGLRCAGGRSSTARSSWMAGCAPGGALLRNWPSGPSRVRTARRHRPTARRCSRYGQTRRTGCCWRCSAPRGSWRLRSRPFAPARSCVRHSAIWSQYYGERFGFPTRTELDDVHRAVTELRRELRALRRHNRKKAAAAQPEPTSVPVHESRAVPARHAGD